jgi:peptidoglycan/xylan/chitin deacetylase (PgdA/CDA1 family)
MITAIEISQKVRSLVSGKEILTEIIRRRGGIYVLMYHSVSADRNLSSYKYDIPVSSFRSQLATLNSIVEFIHPADLRSMEKIPVTAQPQVLLTFDDGYHNNYSVAYPVLREFDVPALLFLSTNFIDSSLNTFLNWSQVRELASDNLITIGSHACSHWNLEALDSDDVEHEIQQSKRRIEEKTSQDIYSISYPGGGFNKEVIQHLKQNKYELGFKDRSQAKTENEYTLSRISIDQSNSQPCQMLRSMIRAQPINTKNLF